MKMKRELTKEDGIKIKEYRKKIQDKRTDRRMLAVQQRSKGKHNKDIAEILEVDPRIVILLLLIPIDKSIGIKRSGISQWVRMYLDGGIEGLLPKKKSGRPPKLTYEQEEAILNEFKDKAEAGQMIEVSEIKTAYEKAAGKSKSHGQIYRVLHRHGWRKIKPRSRHPKKASPEAIEASKNYSKRQIYLAFTICRSARSTLTRADVRGNLNNLL